MNYLTNLEDKAGVRWIPLIDIGVAIHTEAAEDGIRKGVFLNSSIYDRPLIACVWPGSVYVPDFNHPASYQYWNESLYSMNTVL